MTFLDKLFKINCIACTGILENLNVNNAQNSLRWFISTDRHRQDIENDRITETIKNNDRPNNRIMQKLKILFTDLMIFIAELTAMNKVIVNIIKTKKGAREH